MLINIHDGQFVFLCPESFRFVIAFYSEVIRKQCSHVFIVLLRDNMPGKCLFNKLWLKNCDYAGWLAIHPKGLHSMAFCRVCDKGFDISNMGEAALKSHTKGSKHQNLLEKLKSNHTPITSFLMLQSGGTDRPRSQPNGQQSEIEPGHGVGNASGQSHVSSFVSKDECLKAEILWTLKVVTSHYSFRSASNTPWLFQTMFPDSLIAEKMTMSERKCAYLSTFGLGPHFLTLLRDRVKTTDGFVLMFDESLNEQLQKKQLDILVRFWDGDKVFTYLLI